MSRCHFGNDGLKSGKQFLSETPGHSASVGVPKSLRFVSNKRAVGMEYTLENFEDFINLRVSRK
jgi:hypothetical protein